MKVTFDTNAFITYKVPLSDLPSGFYLSAVVLAELVTGAPDASTVKAFRVVYEAYQRKGRMLVPDREDWWEVGKILNSLQRGRRAEHGGSTPRITAEERVRITNDTLIARTAKREGVAIVTDNLSDFAKIKRFCSPIIIPAADYFRPAPDPSPQRRF